MDFFVRVCDRLATVKLVTSRLRVTVLVERVMGSMVSMSVNGLVRYKESGNKEDMKAGGKLWKK